MCLLQVFERKHAPLCIFRRKVFSAVAHSTDVGFRTDNINVFLRVEVLFDMTNWFVRSNVSHVF